MLDDKLKAVTSALVAIDKFGWCCLGESRPDEIEIVKQIITNCGKNYSIAELPHGTIQIFCK